MRGTDFANLNAFAAVVEHRSFARAAAHLGVTPSALSQTIRQLEERLGVRLLNRTTRSVAPTTAGERLYQRLRPAVDELDAAVTEATSTRERPAGVLRINAPRTAALRLIAPRLGRFHRDNPGVILDVTVDDALTDIVAGRFDAGIRLGELLEKDMIAVRLTGEMEMIAVASPDYLARHGTPETPDELHNHACLNWRWPTDGSLYRWEFEENGREFEIAVNGPIIANDIEVVLQAALQGLGIAYASHEWIEGWLKEGKLVRVLERYSPKFPGVYLYHPSRRQQPPALRAFIDCLLDRQA
ncbi:LysR family transcriptional regulator [Sphingomonas asaccharolytica]|uniref:LysR family transcriptional regulator n=1 Tax=Sphingomonas asaccharolytica TaxID=40681 RepID=UPI0008329770|nr:LysR family transcriptional regulator [Sphingomonas asaccharolytica]